MFFSLQNSILLAIALGNFGLATYVLFRNPRHLVHWSFFVFVSGFSLWMASFVLIVSTRQLIFNQFIFYGGITALLGLFSLACTFPTTRKIPPRFWLYCIPIIGLYLGVPFNAFVSGITVTSDNMVVPINGWAFPLFILIFAGYTIISFYIFFKRYRKLIGREKQQMQYFFWGIFLFFLIVLVVDVLLPAVGIYQFNVFGAFASLAFTILTSYTIIRSRLFDLRLILLRTLSFINVLIVFAIVLAFVLFAGTAFLFNVHITVGQYIFGLILMVSAMLAFQPLQKIVRRLTNVFFFQDIYDSEKLLSELTLVMAETIDIDTITIQLLTLVNDRMHISKGAFLLVNDHHITDIKGIGYTQGLLALSDMEVLLHSRSEQTRYSLYDELQDENLKETFQKFDIAVAIPILVETNEVAILVLGPKLSGEIYYQRDIDVLSIFASEAGVAIQNAKSYAEIKRFSTHLEQMVEERTKQLQEAQQREIEKAHAMAKLKDEFVFIAAHELRTPVTVIRGFMEMIETSGEKFSKQTYQFLEQVQSASNHLNQLVNDLLDVARSDAGTMKVDVSPMDIVPIVQEVIEEVSSLAQAKHLKLQLHTDPQIPHAQADSAKLKEVLTNLISNAIKYNRDNGTIDVTLTKKSHFVAVDVKDTGFGIPKDQQAKIFQKFFRAESEHTRDIVGTGLGLFITRMLIEKMGGTISFTSQEGVGTTFTFTLPAAS